MPDGFSNPIAGGDGSIIRPALKSPNYAAGSTGWSINKDGSAEFNGVTVRGTIILGNGTANTIILDNTRDAIFVYDNAGHLVQSIAPVGGNDSFGNSYQSGIVNYLPGNVAVYTQISNGLINLSNGVTLPANVESEFGGGVNADQPGIRLISSNVGGDSANLDLWGGSLTQAPYAEISGSGANLQMDVHIAGTLRWAPGGRSSAPETWHRVNAAGGAAPAFNANWSNTGGAFGAVSYLHTTDGCVKLTGVCQYAGAIAAPQTIFTLPAGYRPNRDVPMEVTAIGSDGAFQASEVLVIRSSGAVVLTSWTGTGIVTPITLESVEFPLTV